MSLPSESSLPPALPDKPIPCPRCGYDQRGPVAAWKNSCPLAGKCSECGLDFIWCDLLNPNLIRPQWCVEYAEKWWHIPGKSTRTIFMMFRPRRFWSSLKMTHELRWKRLIGFIIILLIIQYLAFAFSVGWRVGQQISWLNGPSSQVTKSAFYAAIMPFSTNPPAWYFFINPGGRVVPVAPFDIVCYRPVMSWNMTGVASSFLMSQHGYYPTYGVIIEALPFSVLTFAVCIFAPLGFALLPVSRKQAKVRWCHIARITLYSMVIVTGFNLFILIRYASLPPYSGNYLSTVVFGDSANLILSIIPLFLIIWWSMATRHYLKMPHAWGIGFAIVAIAMLLGPGLFISVVMLL